MKKHINQNKKIGKSYYNFEKAKNMYANRFEIIVGDEEIVLITGIQKEESIIQVETKTYLTLPSFYRLYDVVISTMNKLR